MMGDEYITKHNRHRRCGGWMKTMWSGLKCSKCGWTFCL